MKLFACSTSRSEAIQLQDMKRLTSRYVVEVCFLGCQKNTLNQPQYLSQYQESTGLVVQRSLMSLPLLKAPLFLLSDDFYDGFGLFFISYLCNIYPYLLPIYSLKRGVL